MFVLTDGERSFPRSNETCIFLLIIQQNKYILLISGSCVVRFTAPRHLWSESISRNFMAINLVYNSLFLYNFISDAHTKLVATWVH